MGNVFKGIRIKYLDSNFLKKMVHNRKLMYVFHIPWKRQAAVPSFFIM